MDFKKFKLIKKLTLVVVSIIFTSCGQSKISYADAVGRMIDMQRLSVLPEPGEQSGMFSSYDRRSKVDSITGKYINWAANDDGLTPQYIRKEGDNMVLAEMEGPGAIVRIWSASPKKGHVKIFIDGEEIPSIDLPFIDYFNTAKFPAFSYPGLVYETDAKGLNNYVPITFQKSIKIVGEPNWGQYYHFNYISFPKGTQVASFKSELDDTAKNALEKVNNIFINKLGEDISSSEDSLEELEVTLQPGETKSILQLEGSRSISSIKMKLEDVPESKSSEVYRKTILNVHWDEEEEPSIWSPLGDFFGSSPGFNVYSTYPMGMKEDGWMYSNWFMPFQRKAEVIIENKSSETIHLKALVTHDKLKGNPKNYGRFHAKWHRDLNPVSEEQWPDWEVLKTKGKGRFVGMFLSVWNPKGGSCKEFGGEGHHWWGEGDEKFFVDDEKFPSTFGTGTEDYFGYAWCIPEYFEQAFHSQNYTQDNMGYQSLNRWQIIDNIPFQNSFEGYMEKYFPNHWPTQYCCVAYWYLDADGVDTIKATPEDEIYGFETPFKVYKQDDVVEGEHLKVVSNSGGWCTTEAFSHETLYNEVSGHKLLLWFAHKNDTSVLKTTIAKDLTGTFDVYANIIKSKDGGVFEMELNGELLPKLINCQSEEDKPSVSMEKIGTVTLEANNLEFTIRLKNGDKGKRLSLDYLKFVPKGI